MSTAAEAADALGVPEADRPAFGEVFAALAARNGGKPLAAGRLEKWQNNLEDARAEVDVRAHLEANSGLLRTLTSMCAAAGGGDPAAKEAKLRRQLEQRFVFMGVYAPGVPLEELMERLRSELESVAASPAAEPQQTDVLDTAVRYRLKFGICFGDLVKRKQQEEEEARPPAAFRLAPGVFDERHLQLRRLAYPYKPACGSNHGSEVLECLATDGTDGATSTLVGYIAAHGPYADDVTVDPRYHGRGIGKALVCGWGVQLSRDGETEVTLDVRACNYPALEMYKSLGFEVVRKHYPGFYDWHGGFRLRARTADLAARAPAGFDFAAL